MKIRKTGSLLFVTAVITILSIATISLTGCGSGDGCWLRICPTEPDEPAITGENGIEAGLGDSAGGFSADKENVDP